MEHFYSKLGHDAPVTGVLLIGSNFAEGYLVGK